MSVVRRLLQKPYLLGLAVLLPAISGRAGEATERVTPDAVLRRMDELYRGRSSKGRMKMRITSPHWQRTLTMVFWSRGMKDTLVRIVAPGKERGTATLKLGNELWNYLPRVNKIIKLPPSMMMSSWMGSDFTNDDLVKESSFREDYDCTVLSAAADAVVRLQLTPRPDLPVVWARILMRVDRRSLMPLTFDYYDEDGRRIRTLHFEKVKEMGGRRIPTVLRLTPHNRKGRETVIQYLNIEFDTPLSDAVFSLRSLRRR